MEQAFSLLLATPIELMGAGRTDAGVHAKKMVAHFDTEVGFDKQIIKDLAKSKRMSMTGYIRNEILNK